MLTKKRIVLCAIVSYRFFIHKHWNQLQCWILGLDNPCQKIEIVWTRRTEETESVVVFDGVIGRLSKFPFPEN